MTYKLKPTPFDHIVTSLSKQRGPAIQYIVYLRDIADNSSRWEKYRDSFAGNVINLNIVSAENALILLCCRIWDEDKDAHSIPNAIKKLETHKLSTAERRTNNAALEIAQNPTKSILEQIVDIVAATSTLKKSCVRAAIQVMRTENLAHLLPVSRDRARNFPDGFENHNVTRYDLYDFAEDSIKLCERLEHLRIGTCDNFEETAAAFRTNCEAFWSSIPVFRDVESE